VGDEVELVHAKEGNHSGDDAALTKALRERDALKAERDGLAQEVKAMKEAIATKDALVAELRQKIQQLEATTGN
jgi:uncharacterized coiled-coil DUF342 family protein